MTSRKLQSFLEQSKKYKTQQRNEQIQQFKHTITDSFKRKSVSTKSIIYDKALNYAMDTLFECITLPLGEILNEFSTNDNVLIYDDRVDVYHPTYTNSYRIQTLTNNSNTILLPLDMEIPTRYDTKTQKTIPIEFRVNWMYRNDKFMKRCNDYYSQFGLTIHFQNINRYKWKIELKTKNGYILNPKNVKPVHDKIPPTCV